MTSFLHRLHARRVDAAVFAAMSSLYFVTVFHRVAVPGTIFNELQIGFAATAAQITALSAISLYVYAFMQVPVGIIADRFGGARPLLLGGLIMGAGCIVLPLSHSLTALYSGAVLVSLGSSFMYLCLVKEIDELFDPKRFAPLLGLLLLIGYAGGLAGTSPLTTAVGAYGWRAPLLVVAGLGVTGLIVSAILLHGTGREHHKGAPLTRRAVGELLRTPGAWVMLFFGPVDFAAYMLMQATLGKKFLQDYCQLSPDRAAGATFTMLVVVVAGSFLSGFAPALIGHRRRPIVLTSATAGAIGAAMLVAGIAWSMAAWWFIIGMVLLSAAAALGTVTTTLFKEICPPGATAMAVGLLNAMSYLAVAIASHAAGLVLDAFADSAVKTQTAIIYPAGAYRVIFLGLLVATGAGLLVAMMTPETRGVARAMDGALPTG